MKFFTSRGLEGEAKSTPGNVHLECLQCLPTSSPLSPHSRTRKNNPLKNCVSKYPIGIEPSCSLVLLPDAQSLDPAAASEHRNNVYHLRQQKKTARDPQCIQLLKAFNPEIPVQPWALLEEFHHLGQYQQERPNLRPVMDPPVHPSPYTAR